MKRLLSFAIILSAMHALHASPVSFEWNEPGTMPAKAARPFAGFAGDGSFLFAGGTDFASVDDGSIVKVYGQKIFSLSPDGVWTEKGELPHRVGDGVACEVDGKIFCAGGTDGVADFMDAYLISSDGTIEPLPELPEEG